MGETGNENLIWHMSSIYGQLDCVSSKQMDELKVVY